MFLYLAWWSNVPGKFSSSTIPREYHHSSIEKREREGWRLDERREEKESGDGMLDGKGGQMFIMSEGLFKCHILALIFFSFHFVTQVKSPVEESCRHLEHLSWCWGCCLENLSCTVSASAPRPACVKLPPAGNLRPQILSRVPMAWGSCDRLIAGHPTYCNCLMNKKSRALVRIHWKNAQSCLSDNMLKPKNRWIGICE